MIFDVNDTDDSKLLHDIINNYWAETPGTHRQLIRGGVDTLRTSPVQCNK